MELLPSQMNGKSDEKRIAMQISKITVPPIYLMLKQLALVFSSS